MTDQNPLIDDIAGDEEEEQLRAKIREQEARKRAETSLPYLPDEDAPTSLPPLPDEDE